MRRDAGPRACARRDDPDLRELARLQRAFQRAIAPAASAWAAQTSARALGCRTDALALYRRMGTLRFVGEVAREFPATRTLLGAERFDALARRLVARTQSRSFTLDGYARGLPALLARAARRAPELGAAAELARLERETARVRVARALVPRRRAAASEIGGPRLSGAPGARVLRFAHDVERALARFSRGEPIGTTPKGVYPIAVYRLSARVVCVRLTRAEAALLRPLLSGEPLARAVARGVAAGLAPDAIGDALRRWVAERLLSMA